MSGSTVWPEAHVETSDTRDAVLELTGISKRFPGVLALDDVSLVLRRGEVHALLGENGAGKSTLLRIIAGVYRADTGAYALDGNAVDIHSPAQAFAHGISVVHQERNLVPTFTVAENVLLERIVASSARLVDRRAINRDARVYMEMVGLDVRPDRPVTGLSVAQQQLVEIARGLSASARIILLDEPTASISRTEADSLLATLRRLRDAGVTILYVSHRLEEVYELCDSVTVLRDGRNAGSTTSVRALDHDRLIELMIGRSGTMEPLPVRSLEGRTPVLEVVDRPSETSPAGVSFTLFEGEILGWYGLVGAGRTELARSIIGADRVRGGVIRLRGREISIPSVTDALRRWRIGYVTENRQTEGLFLTHSVARNIGSTVWGRLRNRAHLVSPTAERGLAEEYRDALSIRTPSVDVPVMTLSGGNRQKVSLAKWLAAKPDVLFIDEPTVGIDIGTKNEIHHLIQGLAEGGISIVVISSDMPEMVRLADRVLVFRRGEIVGERVNTHDLDEMSAWIMARIIGAPTAGAEQSKEGAT